MSDFLTLNDSTSRWYKLHNGLPQGSVLSCLLFNLYIHDLPKSGTRKFLYADDAAFAYQGKNSNKISEKLTNDLSTFGQHCKKWLLITNLLKTVTFGSRTTWGANG